jgi:hypothetical protein
MVMGVSKTKISKKHPAMRPVINLSRVRISALEPDPENARLHDENNIDTISMSLAEFGQVENIVVQKSRMRIIGGHGRITALKRLNHEFADVNLLDLTDTQAKALGLLLNRSAELAEWDYKTLAFSMKELQSSGYDIDKLGWQKHEYETLLAADWSPSEIDESNEFDKSNGGDSTGKPIYLTEEQHTVFMNCAAIIRKKHGDHMTDGRIIELLAADYLAGPGDE